MDSVKIETIPFIEMKNYVHTLWQVLGKLKKYNWYILAIGMYYANISHFTAQEKKRSCVSKSAKQPSPKTYQNIA